MTETHASEPKSIVQGSLIITINATDGREWNDIPRNLSNIDHIENVVAEELGERGLKYGEWSSVVIVWVPGTGLAGDFAS